MTRRIFKYPLPGDRHQHGAFTLEIPCGQRFLYVALQDGERTMWIEVDTDTDKVSCHFEILATGEEVGKSHEPLGTFFQAGYVWHLYRYTPGQ